MSVMKRLTLCQLQQNRTRTVLTFFEILIATSLLTAVVVGGQTLAQQIQVRDASLLAPLVRAATRLLAALILITVATIIRESFSLSLSQRVRALGQLASIGATRSQLRMSVYWEVLLLGCFAIPAGVLAAIGGLSLTFFFLNRFDGVQSLIGVIHMTVSAQDILLCVALAALMLLLSAHRPAKLAFSTQPLQAMRPVVVRERAFRTKELSVKKAIIPQLANKSICRNKTQHRTLTLGMTICTAMILASIAYSAAVQTAYIEQAPTFAYRLYLWGDKGSMPQDAIAIATKAVPDVQTVAVEIVDTHSIEESSGQTQLIRLFVLADSDFVAWYGKPLEGTENTIPCVLSQRDSTSTAQIPELSIYQTAALRQVAVQETPLPLRLGEKSLDVFEKAFSVEVTNRSSFDTVIGTVPENRDRSFAIYYDVKDGSTLNQTLPDLLARTGVRYTIQDYTETSEWQNHRIGMEILLNVFLWGFTVLVLCVCAASIWGNVNASLEMRKREFALLCSIGVTSKQLHQMIWRESFSYSVNGLLLGTPIGFAAAYMIANMLDVSVYHVVQGKVVLAGIAGIGTILLVSMIALIICQRQLSRLTILQGLQSVD